MRISKYRSPEFQPRTEGIAYLVAEWISVKEINGLQSACALVSIKGTRKGVCETIRCGKSVRRMTKVRDG